MTSDRLYPAKKLAEDVIGVRGKKWVKYAAFQARTALGAPPFANVHRIDRDLLRHIGKRPGFFIEAGGNDGWDSSNTYYFEKALGWDGFLVEPVPELAAMARLWRRCPTHQVALGSPEMRGRTVTLNFDDGMSKIDGPATATRKWAGWFGRNPVSAEAEIVTLSDLIDQAGNPDVTLLSLDVEGYELEVLKGLDTKRHTPEYVVIETFFPNEALALIGPRYEFVEQLGTGDPLFRRR